MFADGSEVEADIVVYCTGYKVTFPFFDAGADRGARQRPAAVPARVPPAARRACSSSGCCSRSGRSCRSPRCSRSGCATTSPAATRCRTPAALRADIEHERERMFKRYVASKRHTMQVDYDDYLADLRRSAGAAPSGRGQRPRAAGAAAGGRGRGMSAPAVGRRERTKAANRAAILAAARDVFAEDGYDAAGVRDIIRRTDLASGTFYNYFPDKDAIFRALVEETGAEARRRVRAARRRAATAAGVRRGRLRRVLRVHRRGPGAVRVHAPQPRHAARRGSATRCSRRAPTSWPRTCAPASPPAIWRRSTSSTVRTR